MSTGEGVTMIISLYSKILMQICKQKQGKVQLSNTRRLMYITHKHIHYTMKTYPGPRISGVKLGSARLRTEFFQWSSEAKLW